MNKMFSWLSYNRPDIEWLKGPDSQGNYIWDFTLPNQSQIEELIRNFDENWINPLNVPLTVTPRQIRVALILSGISLDLIEQTINSLEEPNRSIVRVTWEYSVEFQRNNPFIVSMAPLLNLTESQVDQLFILASTL